MNEADYDELIPELRRWNNGNGIDVVSWVGCVGTFPLAIGFTALFWPKFTLHRSHVLFADFSSKSFNSFAACGGGDRRAVEATMNHRHLLDLFVEADGSQPDDEVTENQIRHFGRMLREMWQAKVRIDLPAENVVVLFNDEPVQDWLDWIITVKHLEP